MVDQIIFGLKWLLLVEAVTHALKSWGIFDDARAFIAARSAFLARLLACFECSAVWVTTGSLVYLVFVDFWPITFIIIISRLATLAHIFVDLIDALRASTINKI